MKTICIILFCFTLFIGGCSSEDPQGPIATKSASAYAFYHENPMTEPFYFQVSFDDGDEHWDIEKKDFQSDEDTPGKFSTSVIGVLAPGTLVFEFTFNSSSRRNMVSGQWSVKTTPNTIWSFEIVESKVEPECNDCEQVRQFEWSTLDREDYRFYVLLRKK